MAYSDNLPTLLAALNGLTQAEKFNIGNAILTETFTEKNIKDTHITMSEVRNGSKVPILLDTDDFGGFPFTAGDCTLPSCTINSNWSEFEWAIKEIGCKLTICMQDFSTDFLAFFNTWKKMNGDDIESAMVQFIIDRFQKKHLKAEIRVAYFGDTSSASSLIDGFDGFFTQMEALVTSSEAEKVDITENDTETVITDGEDVYNYLSAMYAKASTKPWFDPAQMVFRIDRSAAMALAGFLNNKSDLNGYNCNCIDPEKVVNARVFQYDNLAIFGIPVEPLPFIAAMKAIPDFYTSGAWVVGSNPNRMILARREAMLLGYEVEETLNKFDVGYNAEDRYIYINGSSEFGSAVPVPYFVLAI